MKALIFAAGLGTRLKPLTDTMPKALVPVDGHPLLWHVIEKLKTAGINDIVINVHHFPDMIVDYLKENDNFGVNIQVSDERDFLRETGGGIKYAEPLLGRESDFLVHNVDILSNLDLGWLRSVAVPDALANLVVSDRKTKRYFLFRKSDLRLMGWTNIETGEVRTPFEDLDVSDCVRLAFSGIHIISGGIFEAFEKEKVGEKFSITDFYIKACAEYPIYGIVPPDLRLMDVGKLDTLAAADEFARGLQSF